MPNNVFKRYESLESIIADANYKTSLLDSASRSNSSRIDRGGQFEVALALALTGWPEGTEKIAKYLQLFEAKIGSKLVIDEYFYDVTGQDFDLDRVLLGEPEAWLNSEPVVVNAPATQVLKVCINIGARAFVSSGEMMRKGAASLALVALLERARRRVEVEIVSKAIKVNGDSVEVRLTAKTAGQELDLGKLAFCLIHPAMLRRVIFSIREKYLGKSSDNHKVGGSVDVAQGDADILINCDNGGWNWGSDSRAEEWILEELKKQGVEIKVEPEPPPPPPPPVRTPEQIAADNAANELWWNNYYEEQARNPKPVYVAPVEVKKQEDDE